MPTAYITAPRDAAEDLAALLVQQQLAACVNIVECTSTYRWEGEIHECDPEAILLAKTTADRYPKLKRQVSKHHPYEVPCIERFEETEMTAAFGDWVQTATTEE